MSFMRMSSAIIIHITHVRCMGLHLMYDFTLGELIPNTMCNIWMNKEYNKPKLNRRYTRV